METPVRARARFGNNRLIEERRSKHNYANEYRQTSWSKVSVFFCSGSCQPSTSPFFGFCTFPSDSYPPCTCLRGMRAIQCRSVSAVSAAKPVAKLVKRQRGLLSGQCRPGVLVADTQTHNSAESYSLLVVVSRFCHSNGPHE